MFAGAGDLDIIAAAAGQRILQARLRIERGAILVEARHGEAGAVLHLAALRRERAGQQIDERRLARAIGADEAEPVAAQNARPKNP